MLLVSVLLVAAVAAADDNPAEESDPIEGTVAVDGECVGIDLTKTPPLIYTYPC